MKKKTFFYSLFFNGEVYQLQSYRLMDVQSLLFYFKHTQNQVVLDYNKKIFQEKNWSLKKVKHLDTLETISIVGGG